MNLHIPEKWEPFIRAKMESGEYASPEALLEVALQLLQWRDMEANSDAIDPLGVEDLLIEGMESGPATPWTAQDWEDIRREGDRRLAERKDCPHQ